MRKYGCFQAIFLSFFSRDLYRDVAQNWNGNVIWYLLTVIAIMWGALMFPLQNSINQHSRVTIEKVMPQFPTIKIENGKVITPEKRPYAIKDPEDQDVIVMIDTSGKYKTLESANTDILVTETEMLYKNDKTDQVEVHTIPSSIQISIVPEIIKEKMIGFAGFAWLLLLPFLILCSAIYRLLQALIYAVFGKIFALTAGVNLRYGELYKLTLVAITPTIVVSTIFCWIDYQAPFLWCFYFILSMGYLIFAILANKVRG